MTDSQRPDNRQQMKDDRQNQDARYMMRVAYRRKVNGTLSCALGNPPR